MMLMQGTHRPVNPMLATGFILVKVTPALGLQAKRWGLLS
jgi:hypothetical protein